MASTDNDPKKTKTPETNFNTEKNSEWLPIQNHEKEIINLVKENDMTIIVGDTGSGKSTKLSQFFLAHNLNNFFENSSTNSSKKFSNKIAITQPRRVGAISLATRVSEELNVKLGAEVGYTIRFDDTSTDSTLIRYMTDGCLLRECLVHSLLEPYSIIVLDEAHERSLSTDILFALVRSIVRKRRENYEKFLNGKMASNEEILAPLKLVVTSATLNSERFSRYFDNCPVLNVDGRCFPVEIFHSKETSSSYLHNVVETVLHLHKTKPVHINPINQDIDDVNQNQDQNFIRESGHILAFLTGRKEIERACEILGRSVDALIDDGVDLPDIVILPAYSALPSLKQQQLFQPVPLNCRKVIFATNIAETSLTVRGISYVVDSGYVKQRNFNAKTGIDSLGVIPISRVAARQRAGRAGRTCNGQCFRLYSKRVFENEMLEETEPEIKRTSLQSTVLILKNLSVKNVLSFDFMDKPDKNLLIDAIQQLYYLNALDQDGNLTFLGKLMAQFPLEPSLAKLLLLSLVSDCLQEMLSIIAIMSCSDDIWSSIEAHSFQERKRKLDKLKKDKKKHSSSSSSNTDTESEPEHEPLTTPQQKFASKYGDHITLLFIQDMQADTGFSKDQAHDNGLHFRELSKARNIREQLESLIEKNFPSSNSSSYEKLCQFLLKQDLKHIFDLSLYNQYLNSPKILSEIFNKYDAITRCRLCISICFYWSVARIATNKTVGSDRGNNASSLSYRPLIASKQNSNNLKTMNISISTFKLPHYLYMHPVCPLQHCKLPPSYIVYNKIVQTTKPFMQGICSIDYDQVRGLIPRALNLDIQRLLIGCGIENLRDDILPETQIEGRNLEENASDFLQSNIEPTSKNIDKKRLEAIESMKERYKKRKRR